MTLHLPKIKKALAEAGVAAHLAHEAANLAYDATKDLVESDEAKAAWEQYQESAADLRNAIRAIRAALKDIE